MEELSRITRDAPPSHLRLKVESFSTLSSSSLARYESSEFKAGDYKWKLALYPNGNKSRDTKDHISLYLVSVDNNKEVLVNFSLFLFDHVRNKYLSVQGLSRFHEMKDEFGFDKFLPLATFKDHLSGYLNNGTCVFGAEVFPIKHEPKGSQCLSMVTLKPACFRFTCLSMVTSKPAPVKYTCNSKKFQKLDKKFYHLETIVNMEGLSRLTRDAPPSHLRLKIESFSILSSSSLARYESSEFEAGDHKWRLALYPNGNKSRGIKNHISLYLVLVDMNKEVLVNFSLFLFDHIRNKYLLVQGLSRFHEMKNESGFNKFLPLATFKDHSSGYLNNGTCVFGAEVFCIKSEPKGSQCLSMVTAKPAPFKFTWNIEKFSKLDKEYYYSEIFTARGHDWKLGVYPKGYHTGKGNSVSLYLNLADSKPLLAEGGNIVTEIKLRVVDQVGSTHKEVGTTVSYKSLKNYGWGCQRFLSLSELNKGTGYLVNDTCVLQAEIIVLGSSK